MNGKKIYAVFLALALAVSCLGCGQNQPNVDSELSGQDQPNVDTDQTDQDQPCEEAELACQQFFNAYTAGEGEQVGDYLSGGFAAGEFSSIQNALAKHTSIELKSSVGDEDTAQVNAVITCIDIAAVMQALPQDIDSKKSAKKAMLTAFDEENVPLRDFEITIELVKIEDKWLVSMNSQLSDALLGGFHSMLEEMAQEVGQ